MTILKGRNNMISLVKFLENFAPPPIGQISPFISKNSPLIRTFKKSKKTQRIPKIREWDK